MATKAARQVRREQLTDAEYAAVCRVFAGLRRMKLAIIDEEKAKKTGVPNATLLPDGNSIDIGHPGHI